MRTEAIKIYASVARVEMCFSFYCRRKKKCHRFCSFDLHVSVLVRCEPLRIKRHRTSGGEVRLLEGCRSPFVADALAAPTPRYQLQTIIIHDETVFMRSKLIAAIFIVHTQSLFAFC